MKLPTSSGIYKIVSPIGKTYIGRALNIRHRYYGHKNNSSEKTLIGKSIIKHGIDNHEFSIICFCEPNYNILNELEIQYIKAYRSFVSFGGLNMTLGGSGNSGYNLSQKTKDKISKANKGLKSSLGRKMSVSTRKKISEALKGIELSAESINKIRTGLLKMGRGTLILNLETGIYYESLREATYSQKLQRAKLTYQLKNNIHKTLKII